MNEENKSLIYNRLVTLLIFASLLILLFNIKETIIAVREALLMCAHSVVPSLFPFMLMSDILITYGDVGFFANTFGGFLERLFGIPKNAAIVFVLGLLCGFPIGGKLACKLYSDGFITEKECQRLSAICNTASPAFVIGTVGSVFLSNIRIGIALYITQIMSVMLYAFISKTKENNNFTIAVIPKGEKKSITASVKDSALSAIYLSAFIISFSLICKFISIYSKNQLLSAIISTVLELGSAAKYISAVYSHIPFYGILLLSFSISFSGLSVYMQTKVYFDTANIKMKGYIVAKLVIGAFAAIISVIFINLHIFTL